MGHSIFYSLSLPATVSVDDAEHKLSELASAALRLAEDTEFEIGDVRRLSKADLALSQATMNDDFDFARSACQLSGASRKSALGEVPEVAMYFRIWGASKVGLAVGVAHYQRGARFMMPAADGGEAPYDGCWYFWTFVDAFSKEQSDLLKSVLQAAAGLGFETTYRNEAGG